jgi:aminoglycoside 3-N-acetyltransferase
MPDAAVIRTREPVTRSRLARDLNALGMPRGDTVMAHIAFSSLGWVVGGAQTVVRTLLDCLGPDGTVCAQASWDDIPFGLASWPRAWREAYEAELPAFDPSSSAAAPSYLFPARELTRFAVRWLEDRFAAE